MKCKRKSLVIFALTIAVLVVVSPLNVLIKAAIAAHRSTEHFLVLEPRIQYEVGAETIAALAAPTLDASISLIETHQALPFPQPIELYVTATWHSFERLTAAGGNPRAVMFNQKIFLSPKLANQPERIAPTVTHELSHLHLSQQLGSWRYSSLPTWFQEGLATYLSDGAGAETVSEAAAIAAIKSGQHFIPNMTEHMLFPQSAARFNLTVHMFYQQASLFVAYLDEQHPEAIGDCIVHLHRGKSFRSAFETAFSTTVEKEWADFLKELRLDT